MNEQLSGLREASGQIEQGLRAIAEASVYFAIATLILAVLAALLLQAFYDFWLRRATNRKTTYRWLSDRRKSTFRNVDKLLSMRPVPEGSADNGRAGRESLIGEIRKRSLLEEVAIGEDSPVFDLPFPKLCAQISAALQTAIDLDRAPAVLLVFAGVGDSEILPSPQGSKQESRGPLDEELSWISALVSKFETKPKPREVSTEQLGRERQILTSRVERGVDELQSELARVWARSVYVWSFGISLLLLLILLFAASGVKASLASFIIIVAVVLAAALLAPPLQRLIARAFVAR